MQVSVGMLKGWFGLMHWLVFKELSEITLVSVIWTSFCSSTVKIVQNFWTFLLAFSTETDEVYSAFLKLLLINMKYNRPLQSSDLTYLCCIVSELSFHTQFLTTHSHVLRYVSYTTRLEIHSLSFH